MYHWYLRGNETGEEETLGNWAALSQSSLTFLRTFPPLFSTQNLTRRNPWKLAALSQWLNFQGFLLHCLSRATPFTESPATWQRPTHSPTWHTAKTFPTFPLWWFDALEFSSFSSPCNAWSELAVVEQLAGGGTYHLADNPPYHYPTPPSPVFTQFLLFLATKDLLWSLPYFLTITIYSYVI